MDPIYVTGHRNPDTDSIVGAMAYAALRNACGDREYEAACLGRVSDETQIVLDHFGFQPPKLITNMHTQIQDLEFDTPYNTYLHRGLTPGPICLPSITAIDAVLDYENHSYLYFCAKEDFSGRHYFSKSLAVFCPCTRCRTIHSNMDNIFLSFAICFSLICFFLSILDGSFILDFLFF